MNRQATVALALCLMSGLTTTGYARQFVEEQSGQDDLWEDMGDRDETVSPFNWSGFLDVAGGTRLQSDPYHPDNTTLADVRMQLQGAYTFSESKISFRGDALYNGAEDSWQSQIRELYWQGNLGFLGEAGKSVDVKAGQQILTWGTGDYLFLNDLFPKDYQSFFAGRDDDYLKYPSLSMKVSGYFNVLNVDVVITPEFEPDNGINGDIFSYFNPQTGENTSDRLSVSNENTPDKPEYALRLYRTLAGTELAVYGYKGFSKLPQAADVNGLPRYSELSVTGFSAVRAVGPGLGKLEYAFHDGEDTSGNDPHLPNDQSRFLVGYEQELIANLTGGIQWYTELTHDHEALMTNSLWPQYEPSQRRHVFTTQLRYQAWRQTLSLQAFNFYSPTDGDGYLRLKATWSPVDTWQLGGGLNLFYGDEPHTFYSQFRDASNVYASFRYYFGE